MGRWHRGGLTTGWGGVAWPIRPQAGLVAHRLQALRLLEHLRLLLLQERVHLVQQLPVLGRQDAHREEPRVARWATRWCPEGGTICHVAQQSVTCTCVGTFETVFFILDSHKVAYMYIISYVCIYRCTCIYIHIYIYTLFIFL